MDPKPWYQSKTIWANVIVIVVAIGLYLQAQPGVIPDQYAVYFAAFLGSLNIILRFLSDQPVTLRRVPKGEEETEE